MHEYCPVRVCLSGVGHSMLNSWSFDRTDDGMSGWSVMYNHFKNVTQVQNAYSSRDITFMHNTIEHVLSNEALNGPHDLHGSVFHTCVHACALCHVLIHACAVTMSACTLQRTSFARSTSMLCHERAQNSASFFCEYRALQLFLPRTARVSRVDKIGKQLPPYLST